MPQWLIVAISILWLIHFLWAILSTTATYVHNNNEITVYLKGKMALKRWVIIVNVLTIPFTIFWWSFIIFS
ncbi:hypothetical protein HYP99_gp012 [Sinorhizobium phage ort11]|uniref:Transmembrane protein n=1 Tax=Sinorhizobium phage ort11 TaxID=2599764 RepID=A0A5C2H1Y4_9CAUD|nr:hypothetical protein HYP99_gp012 [Sinorhizobium phage ort11]QEP29810.1 hypothetical protein Smphiort11_012 [Sinorhizobium phage ort11]